ncbi:MAG TPA: response regulator [Phycisphaerae bacterium]|nr:response regulator [Phycisphaerales bacterium]HRX84006.1 response regulator [Phycisphaerae bacterium]
MYVEVPRILLIDDDRDIHESVTAILHPHGYRVTCCWTGPSGLAELRRARPDLLLLDIMLSSPTEGLDLAREIRGDPEISHTPIVLISAMGRQNHLPGRTELPADEYLEKPLTAERLVGSIERVLRAHGRVKSDQ